MTTNAEPDTTTPRLSYEDAVREIGAMLDEEYRIYCESGEPERMTPAVLALAIAYRRMAGRLLGSAEERDGEGGEE